MLPRSFVLLALLLAFAPGLARAEEKWSHLKLGMSAQETFVALGRPTLRTAGRGFEIWNYDNGAEVLFVGSLIGWTAPASPTLAVRSVDIWQDNRDKTYFPTFLSRLSQPVVRRSIPLRDDGANRSRGDGFWAPFYLNR